MIRLKVKEIIKSKNKSIYWLSNETSLAYPTLHSLVNEKTSGIQFNTLEEIMNALDIKDFNEILEFIPEDSKEE